MSSINKVIISGNLGNDAELRSTASGMPVLGFGIAVNERRRNKQTGEWEDYVNWIDCTMFGNRAQSISRYMTKGTKVCAEGKLRWSQWESDGHKRSKVEVIVDEIEFMSRADGQQQYGQEPQQYVQAPQMPPKQYMRQVPQQQYQYPQQTPQTASQPVQQGYAYGAPQTQGLYDEEIPF